MSDILPRLSEKQASLLTKNLREENTHFKLQHSEVIHLLMVLAMIVIMFGGSCIIALFP